ncbi:MAG: TonB-dependent receptor [Woeseiaceae bacterium]|jgi:iron complex outermembrane receptor protein
MNVEQGSKQSANSEDRSILARTKPTAIALAVATACAMPVVEAADLEEVVVTASRREQSLMEVPYNISAYTAADLAKSRVHDLNEIARMVPGLTNIEQGPSARGNNNNFVLRGLNANTSINSAGVPNQTVSPVSTYIGETPMFFPITVKDIERVEVLRGPQGTLYGSGAAGGTIRILPRRPQFDETTWEVNASASMTEDSDEGNYDIDAVANIALSDQAALRLVAGYQQLGGFVDATSLISRAGSEVNSIPDPAVANDLASGFVLLPVEEDINDSDDWFVRASFRWQPSDTVDLQLNFHHQETTQDSEQAINGGFAGGPIDISLAQVPGSQFLNAYAPLFQYYGFTPYPNGSTVFPGTSGREQGKLVLEPYERQVDLVNLDAKVDFGFATFTSATSFFSNDSEQTRDITGFGEMTPVPDGAPLSTFYGYFPRLTLIDTDITEDEAFVQEFRLASNWDKNWDFVVGAYYMDSENTVDLDQYAAGLGDFRTSAEGSAIFDFVLVPGFITGAVPQADDGIFFVDRTFEFEDVAVFGEFTMRPSEQWQVTAGVRAFWQEFDNQFQQQFPFCSFLCASDLTDPLGTSVLGGTEDFQDQVFKFNTSYNFNEDLMGYFTWAEGFRRGGANAIATSGLFASLPDFQVFDPDKATNWEVGLKGRLSDRVNYTISGFFIEWDEFQFDDFTPAGLIAVFNGRQAESQGLELTATGQLSDEFSFMFGYTYTSAEATEAFTISDLPFGAEIFGLDPVEFFAVEKGDPLPGVPEHTATVALDYVQPLSNGNRTLNYHLNGAYRSDSQSQFNPDVAFGRQYFETEAFTILDASLTLDAGNWAVGLFIDNITDEDGITGGLPRSTAGARGEYFYVTRPRTIGLAVRFSSN